MNCLDLLIRNVCISVKQNVHLVSAWDVVTHAEMR